MCRILYAGLLAGTLWGGLSARGAWAQAYEIAHYAIHIGIHQQYFDVEETLDVVFNAPRHGIYRTIPVVFRLKEPVLNKMFPDRWLGYRVYISDLEVPGHPDKVSREGGKIIIRIGDKDQIVTGRQQYRISYRVRNAYLAYADRSVFYWNLIGDEWDAPIDSVSYTLSCYQPLSLHGADYEVITGAGGRRAGQATLDYHNGQFSGHSGPLYPGEALTVQIVLPPGYVQPFSTEKRVAMWLGWFLLPLALAGVFITVWIKIGKDRKLITVVSYLPPANINPAMAGFLLDEKSNDNDLISLLPYWAAGGLMAMQYEPKSHFWNREEWIFIKRKNIAATAAPYEQTLFNGLFSSGNSVKLSDLKDSFYKTVKEARRQLRKRAFAEGYYTPDSVRIFHFSQGLLLMAGGALSVFLFAVQQPAAAVFSILVTLVLMACNHLLLRRSAKGDEAFKQIAGFKLFLEKAEKLKLETLLREDPAYFEKTLGYAVAFNLLEKWARRFDGLLQQPPSWYYGSEGASFRMNTFASRLGRGMTGMRTVMTSASRGGGSGGSAGGGFGGGGGGSW